MEHVQDVLNVHPYGLQQEPCAQLPQTLPPFAAPQEPSIVTGIVDVEAVQPLTQPFSGAQ
jgi:hypothetical protein